MQGSDETSGTVNDRELIHQNHELKKRLIRIEYEAKRERSMMLQQFEEMKAKMMDMEMKERFIKTSQASLNELISNINPIRDKCSIGAVDEENKSIITNPYTIQLRKSPSNRDGLETPGLMDFGIDQKSSLKQMITDFENKRDQKSISAFQGFSHYGISPTKFQRSASSHLTKSPQVQKISVSPKLSAVDDDQVKATDQSDAVMEQSPEFKRELATSSDFAGFDFGVNSQDDRRETRDFTPVRVFNPVRDNKENINTDGSRNSPKCMVRIDHSAKSKESRCLSALKASMIPRHQSPNSATPNIRDFTKEDDSKSIDIVSTTMQKMSDKDKRANIKQRVFYNKPVEKANQQTTPIRRSKISDVSSRDMTPDQNTLNKSILNINAINIDFVRGKIGVHLKPNQQSSLMNSFKKSSVKRSAKNSPTPSNRTSKFEENIPNQSSPFKNKMLSSDMFSLRGDTSTMKHTPSRVKMAAKYASGTSSRSGASEDQRKDIDCSFVTIRKRNINISDCGSENIFSSRDCPGSSRNPQERRSKSPIANYSSFAKPIAKPIDPPPKQSLLRIKKKPAPTIEKQLRPAFTGMTADIGFESFSCRKSTSRNMSREKMDAGNRSSRRSQF